MEHTEDDDDLYSVPKPNSEVPECSPPPVPRKTPDQAPVPAPRHKPVPAPRHFINKLQHDESEEDDNINTNNNESLYDTLKPSSSQTDVRVSSKEPPPSGEDTPPDSGDYIVMNNAEPPLVTKETETEIYGALWKMCSTSTDDHYDTLPASPSASFTQYDTLPRKMSSASFSSPSSATMEATRLSHYDTLPHRPASVKHRNHSPPLSKAPPSMSKVAPLSSRAPPLPNRPAPVRTPSMTSQIIDAYDQFPFSAGTNTLPRTTQSQPPSKPIPQISKHQSVEAISPAVTSLYDTLPTAVSTDNLTKPVAQAPSTQPPQLPSRIAAPSTPAPCKPPRLVKPVRPDVDPDVTYDVLRVSQQNAPVACVLLQASSSCVTPLSDSEDTPPHLVDSDGPTRCAPPIPQRLTDKPMLRIKPGTPTPATPEASPVVNPVINRFSEELTNLAESRVKASSEGADILRNKADSSPRGSTNTLRTSRSHEELSLTTPPDVDPAFQLISSSNINEIRQTLSTSRITLRHSTSVNHDTHKIGSPKLKSTTGCQSLITAKTITSETKAYQSDDQLSDGGDFYDGNCISHPHLTTTTKPFIHVSVTERSGYLMKRRSIHSKHIGWIKNWVVFKDNYLKYYTNEKSLISKRMIPVASITNVIFPDSVEDTYQNTFQIITVAQKYTFSCETATDRTLWANIIMGAKIACRETFLLGGDMYTPCLQEYAKFENMIRGRRYCVVKRDRFCYYNTEKDFRSGCPISEIPMALVNIKENTKTSLILTTPTDYAIIHFDSAEDNAAWIVALKNAISESLGDNEDVDTIDVKKVDILDRVYVNTSNRYCADCNTNDPQWASINLLITLCSNCAGAHRNLGVEFSKVRSLRMDDKVWTDNVIQLMIIIGNDNANNFWEWRCPDDRRLESIVESSEREQFIIAKYREKSFANFCDGDKESLNEKLCYSVQTANITDTMRLVFCSADMLYKSKSFDNKNAYELAENASQSLQLDFLKLNTMELVRKVQDIDTPSATNSNSDQSVNIVDMKSITSPEHVLDVCSYLTITHYHQKESLRLWCVMEKDSFVYCDNGKSATNKEYIKYEDIISINVTDSKMFTFDIHIHSRDSINSKSPFNVFTMTTDSENIFNNWMTSLVKCMARDVPSTLGGQKFENVKKAGHAGVCFSVTDNDYRLQWIHLSERSFYIYNTSSSRFLEYDLRTVTNISRYGTHDQYIFVINLHHEVLYVQCINEADLISWIAVIKTTLMGSLKSLQEQQITNENVPVIIDKCINFISANGMHCEGIYRRSAQHSMITKLLDQFREDANRVHLSNEDHPDLINLTASVMKRFLRDLEQPVLGHIHYDKWIATSKITDHSLKLNWYRSLLKELPDINYQVMKKLIVHLHRVSNECDINKMTIQNLSAIFSPVLFHSKIENTIEHSFQNTESRILIDLLQNHLMLFEIKEKEVAHEILMEEQIKNIKALQMSPVITTTSEDTGLLVGVCLSNIGGDNIMIKLTTTMRAKEVLTYIVDKAVSTSQLNLNYKGWSLFEYVGSELFRPIHQMELPLEIVMRWASWPEEFKTKCYIVAKYNDISEHFQQFEDIVNNPLYNDFKFCEKKSFKKFYFVFSHYQLSYYKECKGGPPICQWNVEDITIYIGVGNAKRKTPSKWCLTFITEDFFSKHRDNFGYTIDFSTEKELYKWLSCIYHAQHNEGTHKVLRKTSFESSKLSLNLQSPLPKPYSPHSPSHDTTPKVRRSQKFLRMLKGISNVPSSESSGAGSSSKSCDPTEYYSP